MCLWVLDTSSKNVLNDSLIGSLETECSRHSNYHYASWFTVKEHLHEEKSAIVKDDIV